MISLVPWEKLKSKLTASISTVTRQNRILARLDALENKINLELKSNLIASISTVTRQDKILAQIDALENKINLVEYFSHGGRATYVGNNRVLVKAVVANNTIAFFVEANDRLISPWFIVTGKYEAQLTDYFVRELRTDSHCIDVGANFGYFTCLMARFCPQGRVIGIEPDEHVYEIARDNVFINDLNNFASVLHAAAGNSSADMTLYRRGTRSGNTSIAKMEEDFIRLMGEPASETFVVKGVRVDDLLPKMNGRIDFVKIDVEGAEPLVLEGARNTIAANSNLTIVTEWSPAQIQAAGFEVPAFLAALKAMELRSYDIAPHGLVSVSFDDLLNIPYRTGIALKRDP